MRERQKWALAFSGKWGKEATGESGQLSRCPSQSRALFRPTIYSHHWKDHHLQLSLCSTITGNPQFAKIQLSALWKVLLKNWDITFLLPKHVYLFRIQRGPNKCPHFPDRRRAMFSRFLICKSEEMVLPLYPSSLPRCGFRSLSPRSPQWNLARRKDGGRVVVTESIKDLRLWLRTLLCQGHVYLKTLWNLGRIYLKDVSEYPPSGKERVRSGADFKHSHT